MYSVRGAEFFHVSHPINAPVTAPGGLNHRHAEQKNPDQPLGTYTSHLQPATRSKFQIFKSRIFEIISPARRDTEMQTIGMRDATIRTYPTPLMRTLAELQHDNFNRLFRALGDLLPRPETIIHRPIQNSMDIMDANRTTELRAQIAWRAVKNLDEGALLSAAKILLSPLASRISYLTASAAKCLLPGGSQSHLNAASLNVHRLFNVHADLELLCAAITHELQARNMPIPRQSMTLASENDAFSIIQNATGIQLATHRQNYELYVAALPAGAALTQALRDGLCLITRPGVKKSGMSEPQTWGCFTLRNKSGDAVNIMISEAMRLGTGNPTYTYQPLGSNKTVALPMPSCYSDPVQDTQKIQFVFDEIAQSNPQVMRWLSYLGSKNTLKLFLDTLAGNPALNPIKLPDGSSGQIGLSSEAALFCHFVPDHDGGVTIRFRAELQNATTLLPIKEQQSDPDPSTAQRLYRLDPDQSYQILIINFRLGKRDAPVLDEPVTYGGDYKIKQLYIR